MSCIRSDQLQVKQVDFLAVLKEEAEQSAQGVDEQFKVDFAQKVGKLNRVFGDLLVPLDGELKQAK